MRVLFLDQFSDLGGAQQCLLDLLPAFASQGWQATVAAPGAGPLLERSAAQGAEAIELELMQYGSGSKSLLDVVRFSCGFGRLTRTIAGLIQKQDARLLYVNGPRPLPAAASANRSLVAGAIPAVFHSHSYLAQRHLRRLVGISIRRMGASVIGSCEFTAAPWRRYAGGGQVTVVYNGVADAETGLRAPRKIKHIATVGRVSPEKGQHFFVEAVRQIQDSAPKLRFSIIGAPLFGDPRAEQYQKEVRSAAVGLPIDFLRWIETPRLMEGLDLLVVPSCGAEATTRVIPEAFAAGVPVVATRTGGIPEIVTEGVTGFLAEPNSADSLAAAILRAVISTKLDQIARMAREFWRSRLTLDGYRRSIITLIGGIVRERSP